MDDNINNLIQPTSANHNKARWTIIFVACLIVLLAIMFMFRDKMSNNDTQMTPEERLMNSMTARGLSNLSEAEKKKLMESSTAKTDKSKLTAAQKQKLIESMTAK